VYQTHELLKWSMHLGIKSFALYLIFSLIMLCRHSREGGNPAHFLGMDPRVKSEDDENKYIKN
jgi:hypothetical protein